jgi:hypothetical protein
MNLAFLERNGTGDRLAPTARSLQARSTCYLALAFAASQSFFDSSRKPWPLQEFIPLHELFADLQADWPLQELTPVHWTLASSALAVLIASVLNINAAAVAIAALVVLVAFNMRILLKLLRSSIAGFHDRSKRSRMIACR